MTPRLVGSSMKPERVEWLKVFAAHLRQRASDNGCYGEDTNDGSCITDVKDLEQWCDYCRLGESAVQIELLLAHSEAALQRERELASSVAALSAEIERLREAIKLQAAIDGGFTHDPSGMLWKSRCEAAEAALASRETREAQNNEAAAGLTAQIDAAHDELTAAVKRQWDGAPAFKFSIPARPDHDTDLLIGAALRAARKALTPPSSVCSLDQETA